MRPNPIAASFAIVVVAACARSPLQPTDGDLVPASTVGVDVVRGWRSSDGFLISPVLPAPMGATRVALIARVDEGADVAIWARDAATDGALWIPADVTWRDSAYRDDHFVARADLRVAATAVEIKVKASDVAHLRSLTFEAVVPMTPPAPLTTTTLATTTTTTSKQGVLNGYQPRSAWGARAASGCDGNPTKTKVTVHHTVSRLHDGGSRDELTAELRSIQALHMDGRGYCDTGYHFLVTADGTVWEARSANDLGAHTGGQNTNNLGVSFIGCFHPTSDCDGLGSTTPPQVMLDGAGAFIGTATRHYGITLGLGSTLMGHRDNPGQATACPGDNLHARLGALRDIANGGGAAAATGTVQGTVWNLAVTTDAAQSEATGARLPGAIVTVTSGTVVVGTATARVDDAMWSFDLAPGPYTLSVVKAGFAPATRTINVASGDTAWASIVLTPQDQGVEVVVVVVDSVTGAPLHGARVSITGHEELDVDVDGLVQVTVPPGSITISARAEGYLEKTEIRAGVPGETVHLNLGLDVVSADPTGDDSLPPIGDVTAPPEGDDGGLQRVIITNKNPLVQGGCQAATAAAPFAALVPVLLLRRRRRSVPML